MADCVGSPYLRPGDLLTLTFQSRKPSSSPCSLSLLSSGVSTYTHSSTEESEVVALYTDLSYHFSGFLCNGAWTFPVMRLPYYQ